MYRAIPGAGNKTLQKKWESKMHELNQQKLKKVKSRIDFAEPNSYNITKKNSKRDQVLESMH